MTYVIFGAGAVGTSLAAQFTLAGIDAVLVARGAQLDALRDSGLEYQRIEETRQVALTVTDLDSLHLSPDDVLILTVKTQDLAGLAAMLAVLPVSGGGVAADLPVLTLQNGLEAERIAARLFPRLYSAVIRVPASYTRTGHVSVLSQPQFANVVLGRYPHGRDAVSARIVADLTAAEALAEERGDITRWKAQKLLHNVRNVVELFDGTPEEIELAGQALVAEADVVLRAAGHDPATEVERTVSLDGWIVRRDAGGQSTWQSFVRGSSSEVDYLNGEIVLQARLAGLPAPWNHAAQRLAAELAAHGGAPGTIPISRLIAMAQPS